MTSKAKGWTLEVSRKQLQNSALYCLDRSKVMEVDLDAVETQVQKTQYESDTTISDFDSSEMLKEGGEGSKKRNKDDGDTDKIIQYPNAYPYDASPVISNLEHDKKRLKAWMSSTTMAISQKVKSLVNVQNKLLEKTISSANRGADSTPNLLGAGKEPSTESEPRSLDLQTMAKQSVKPTKCYLEFTEMLNTPYEALSSLDPFVIGKAMDVMKAMRETDWEKVKHLYEMFKRAGRLDQLIIYEFAIKIIVNTRGKSGVVDVLRDIDGDLAEAAFRFGKTLLTLYHGSSLLSLGTDAQKSINKNEEIRNETITTNQESQKKPSVPNRGAQIPENVRKSYENPRKVQGPKRTSYAYLFKDATAASQKNQKKNPQNNSLRKNPPKRVPSRRHSPSAKPFIRPVNPKYAHVKSRYREAAAKLVSQPATAATAFTRKSQRKARTPAPATAKRKPPCYLHTRPCPPKKVEEKPRPTSPSSFDSTPPNPCGTPSSSILSTPDSNMDTATLTFTNGKPDSRLLRASHSFIDSMNGLVQSEKFIKLSERTITALSSDDSVLSESSTTYNDESIHLPKGPTGDFITEVANDEIQLENSPFDKGDTASSSRQDKVLKSKSEPKLPNKSDSNEQYSLVSDQDGPESNFSVTTLYKQLPNLRPFIIDRLLMNVLLAYLLAVTGGALCADDSKSLYCTLSLTLKGKLRTMLIRALHLVDDF